MKLLTCQELIDRIVDGAERIIAERLSFMAV